MSEEPTDGGTDARYATTAAQRRRNTITLFVILGLVAVMVAAAIIVPNMGNT